MNLVGLSLWLPIVRPGASPPSSFQGTLPDAINKRVFSPTSGYFLAFDLNLFSSSVATVNAYCDPKPDGALHSDADDELDTAGEN